MPDHLRPRSTQQPHNGKRYLLLCVAGKTCCSEGLSLQVWSYFQRRLSELRPSETGGAIQLRRLPCLRICTGGPIAVLHPEGVWYHSVTLQNAERIIQQHLIGGRIVEDICLARNPRRGSMSHARQSLLAGEGDLAGLPPTASQVCQPETPGMD